MKYQYHLCNYVNCKDSKRLFPEIYNIVAISSDHQISLQNVLSGITYTNKLPKGIPISEFWLESLGFVLVNGLWQKTLEITAIAFLKLKFLDKGHCHPQVCNGDDHVDLDSIQYIHQLQNLHFGLTKKQLTLRS
jgi:hypothetical protein